MTPERVVRVQVALDGNYLTIVSPAPSAPFEAVVVGVDSATGAGAYLVVQVTPGTQRVPLPVTRPGSQVGVVDVATGEFFGHVVVP